MSAERAKERKQADKLACEAWKGPTPPSPTISDAINVGYSYLEVRCLGCDTNQTVALDIIRRVRTTPVHELDVNFQEVVHLVRTQEAEVAKLQRSTECPDEQPQECSPDAERSRGHGAVCGNGTEQCTPPRASSTPRRRWWPNGSSGRTTAQRSGRACIDVSAPQLGPQQMPAPEHQHIYPAA